MEYHLRQYFSFTRLITVIISKLASTKKEYFVQVFSKSPEKQDRDVITVNNKKLNDLA